MIERLLENWLNKANERSFQIPFAQWLAFKGHKVLHITRHCAMELGKDIITIDPDGVPNAFQLKGLDGGRMTLSMWRRDLNSQMVALVNGALAHPSLARMGSGTHHRSWLVVNGDLDEEVQHEIHAINIANERAGLPERKIGTIVKGELFDAFRELQSDFWATNLRDVKTYLELYLEDGRGMLPKRKLSALFEDALQLNDEETQRPAASSLVRYIAGCAVICAAAISSFTSRGNHLAEVEAWTLFSSYVLALSTRWGVAKKHVEGALQVADEAVFSSLGRLCDEVQTRGDLYEGDRLTDTVVYKARLMHLLGLFALYGLLLQERMAVNASDVPQGHLEFAMEFCERHSTTGGLWGEYAIPQMLARNWFRATYSADQTTDEMYGQLMRKVVLRNQADSQNSLLPPYLGPEDALPHMLGVSSSPLVDVGAGSSYYLLGIMHLFTRTNYKMEMRSIFPDATRIAMLEMEYEMPWQFFRYRNQERGTLVERILSPPHSWSALRKDAAECAGLGLPEALRKASPVRYLALLLTMPHRTNGSALRWLSTKMDEWAQSRLWQRQVSE